MRKNQAIIAGAGPVGLALAAFLRKLGVATRVLEEGSSLSHYSRALAVNPRSLELLDALGVTETLRSEGREISQMQFWQDGKSLAHIQISKLQHQYPFMLAVSQSTTELALYECLKKLGGEVEFNSRFEELVRREETTIARISHGEKMEEYTTPWVAGADGSRSSVRKSLGMDFPGTSYDEPWTLFDAPMSTSLSDTSAHVEFVSTGGFVFYLPVYGHDYRTSEEQIWRVLGSVPKLREYVSRSHEIGEPVWESEFSVSHRVVNRMSEGNVFLLGDAAHIHSPMGARGMNTGIEDAWTLAHLMSLGRSDEYNKIRRPVVRKVVKNVEMLTELARGRNQAIRLFRRYLFPFLTSIPQLAEMVRKTVTGVDVPLALEIETSPIVEESEEESVEIAFEEDLVIDEEFEIDEEFSIDDELEDEKPKTSQ